MRKLFLLLLVMIGSMAAHAYDYPYLVFQTSDGTLKAVAVESLSITIADGALVATNGDGTQSFSLADLSKMYFSTENTSSIVSLKNDGAVQVEVFTLTGVSMGMFASVADARQSLPRGIYVLKSQDQTLKITVR